MQLVQVKRSLKDQELMNDEMMIGDEVPVSKRVKTTKVAQKDNFFADEETSLTQEVEKRAVMRDGRVPMMQKNLLKLEQKKIEKQR